MPNEATNTAAPKPTLQFMVRAKLPNPAGYPACPSGDTDFAADFHAAVKAATPAGFAVCDPRPGEHWPKDSEGYTFVPLRAVDSDVVWHGLIADCDALRARLDHYVNTLKALLDGRSPRGHGQ